MTSDPDRVLVDRRRYLPEHSWRADPARCAGAGVPADLACAPTPEEVIAMIRAARTAGMPFAYTRTTVTQNYLATPRLRDRIDRAPSLAIFGL